MRHRLAGAGLTFAPACNGCLYQGFVKSMLDVADNLERAVASVKPEEVETADNERVRKLLKGLLEGISGTDRILMSVLKAEGVERFDPMGQKFDPSQHNALFEFEDASKEPGTVGAVTKVCLPPRSVTINARIATACCLASGRIFLFSLSHKLLLCCLQRGYMIHDRVLRAADVGVVKAPAP